MLSQQPAPTPEHTLHRASTVHIAREGNETIAVDLYRAKGGEAAPWLVYLHGGGWIAGSLKDHRERLEALSELGVSVASVDYRLATEAPYPAQRDDIEAVVRSLVKTGSPVFIMGASAGALIGALAAFQLGERPAGFIGLFGRYDLSPAGAALRPAEDLLPPAEVVSAWEVAEGDPLTFEQRMALLAGVDVEELNELILREMSPLEQMAADAPPLLLIHGTGDAVVDYRHSERLAARARRLGVPCEMVLVSGANHEGPEFSSPQVMGPIADFIQSNLEMNGEKQ